ncbi:7343_t:CDS:2, partial [Dentiscutata erythropus]
SPEYDSRTLFTPQYTWKNKVKTLGYGNGLEDCRKELAEEQVFEKETQTFKNIQREKRLLEE